jgi:FMN-dependent NADH-azoreductase
MSTVLVINSSASGAASVSRLLVARAVERLRAQDPGLRVVARDLGESPIPHLNTDAATAIRGGEPANAAQAAARALSDALIAEVRAADIIVIGAPMYNFGIPSTLKAWFDHLLRAGETFRYTESGFEGLVGGKRAIVVIARGGAYGDGPARAMDFQEPYLRTLLAFVGITDVTFVRAERLALGPDAREQAIDRAQAELRRLTEPSIRRAA